MACNTNSTLDERPSHPARLGLNLSGDLACNTLPYKTAAMREAHHLHPSGARRTPQRAAPEKDLGAGLVCKLRKQAGLI